MRRVIYALLVSAAIFVPTLASAPASANDRDFKLINRTGYTISGLYFSTVGVNSWIPMRGGVIGPYSSEDIIFNSDAGPCNLQFRIETSRGSFEWLQTY